MNVGRTLFAQVMEYPFDDGLRVRPDHLKGILPSKFFTFMEAGIPVIVSQELEYVANLVREHGLGIVITQQDIDSLSALLKMADRTALQKNIHHYRQEHCMDHHIQKLENFYAKVLASPPQPEGR